MTAPKSLEDVSHIVTALVRCSVASGSGAARWQAIRLYNEIKDDPTPSAQRLASRILASVAEGPHVRAHVRLVRS